MKPTLPRCAAIVVAAGRGTRAPGDVPKQYRSLAGESVLSRSLRAFLSHDSVASVVAVIHPDDTDAYARTAPPHAKLRPAAFGGASRAESVANGLAALTSDAPDIVLIHDAARPLVSNEVISRVIAALHDADGAIAALPAVDAMRRVTQDGTLGESVDRNGVSRAQTPQGFWFKKLSQAYETTNYHEALDDAEIALKYGMRVVAVPGDPMNFKLTLPEDFAMAERLLTPALRTGQGFDVHAFGDGNRVILCGIEIPHTHGLNGHSDADVGLHALTDALLGAIADGDIGSHFLPSDPQWLGANSAQFLAYAVQRVQESGYAIGNLDVTLICEQPKIGPHRDAMRARIAEICGVSTGQVGVKATTTERLGFCGRGEGIAAQAVATVVRQS